MFDVERDNNRVKQKHITTNSRGQRQQSGREGEENRMKTKPFLMSDPLNSGGQRQGSGRE